MYGIKDAPKGSPKATIKLKVTETAMKEIQHRAEVSKMSVDEFVRYAGYLNPAMHVIQCLQKLGDPEDPHIKMDLQLISDAALKAQLSEVFENYKKFIGLKYANAFYDRMESGRYTDERFLIGDRQPMLIKTTRWDKENLEGFARLFRVGLNDYLTFATIYDLNYLQPLNLNDGIAQLNEMLDIAKLISDRAIRKTLKSDIKNLRNYLMYLSANSARFFNGKASS